MAWPLEQLEVRARFGGRGTVASAVHEGRRLRAQSTQGFLDATTKLVAMIAFGSCRKECVALVDQEYEIEETEQHADGDHVFQVRKK